MNSIYFFLTITIFASSNVERFADGANSGLKISATSSTTTRTRKNSIASVTSSEWSTLADSLSNDASLHGPIVDSDYNKKCKTLKSDAYAISKAANGICMHSHACAYEFCVPEEDYGFDLPSYTVDVRTEGDISENLLSRVRVIKFAVLHGIELSVKTTGHSYTGSSTKKDTLMIWMQNYPKDGTINDNYTDSCGKNHGPVVGINGGETWNDVLEAVQGKYHIVTGGGRTVSAAGGWLQGGGLSFSSREYGIGVDQVVNFRVVLANSTIVEANACTNEDLFWALRGGGGGTFGVVTHVQYKLHPVTTIIEVNYWYGGSKWSARDKDRIKEMSKWLDFWIEKCPSLDSRWSGFWSSYGAHLVFSGSLEDAKATFFDEFREWYEKLDKSKWNYSFGSYKPSIVSHNNWYEYKGGSEAANDPTKTDATGDAYEGVNNLSSRLMPLSEVMNNPGGVKELLLNLKTLGGINYFLGGKMSDIPHNETSMHPAVRKSIWNVMTVDPVDNQRVREFVNNNVTGVCYNHHNGIEPDWRNACWGDNYIKLSLLKKKYDPDQVFNCWHCVGYTGEEKESNTKIPSEAYALVNWNKITFSIITLVATLQFLF